MIGKDLKGAMQFQPEKSPEQIAALRGFSTVLTIAA